MADALIIGAGVAGAAATRVFVEHGWRVRVIDKASRPGGRCATRRLAADRDSPWYDYGAQYFTARDAAFRALAQDDRASGRLQRWQPAICTAHHDGERWRLETSPDERERFVGPHGLNAWVRTLFTRDGIDVECDRRAVTLARDAARWQVGFDDRSPSIAADAVLVTLPAPQARTLLGDAAAGFETLAHADQALAPCHSLVVEAPALTECHGAFVKQGVLSWFSDNSHKASTAEPTRLWTLHADADYSARHLDESPERIDATLIDAFAAITGLAVSSIRPVHHHRWRYARPGKRSPDPSQRYALDADTRLALAGDWLAGGRIEGAWLSGRAAAGALVAA